MTDTVKTHYEKRNEFLSLYTQFVLAIVVVALLIILLIMGVVEPDAGLPLLAAVAAYILGRTNTNTPTSRTILDGEDEPVRRRE